MGVPHLRGRTNSQTFLFRQDRPERFLSARRSGMEKCPEKGRQTQCCRAKASQTYEPRSPRPRECLKQQLVPNGGAKSSHTGIIGHAKRVQSRQTEESSRPSQVAAMHIRQGLPKFRTGVSGTPCRASPTGKVSLIRTRRNRLHDSAGTVSFEGHFGGHYWPAPRRYCCSSHSLTLEVMKWSLSSGVWPSVRQ